MTKFECDRCGVQGQGTEFKSFSLQPGIIASKLCVNIRASTAGAPCVTGDLCGQCYDAFREQFMGKPPEVYPHG